MVLRWDTDRYNKSERVRIIAVEQLTEWSGYVFTGNENVLDVGCGNGIVDQYLCEKYPDISLLGIDNDREMIRAATETNQARRNLRFSLQDARELGFRNEFDLVISTACLHWIEEQLQVLVGIAKACKPNASVLLAIYPKQPYLWESLDVLMEKAEWSPYFKDFRHSYFFYDEESYVPLAEKAGFKVKKITTLADDFKLKSQEDAENMFASWLPHLHVIPEALHPDFMRALTNTMLEMMRRDNINDFTDYRGRSLNVHLIAPPTQP